MISLQGERDTAHFSLAEREVEMERMKTTLMALSSQVVHCDDYKAELAEYTKAFQNSESIRVNTLQVSITESATKVKVDSNSHLAMHKTDEAAIIELQVEIQRLNAQLASDNQAHLKQIGEINTAHSDALNKLHALMEQQAKKHDADIQAREAASADRISALQTEHATTLAKRDSEHNSKL
jgi:hypothetical protein